jgi:TrmH family RNA methyltransferase
MLSKAKAKEIRGLELKKKRDERDLFVAEGDKLVSDMLPAFECEWLIAAASWMATQGDIPTKELILAEKDEIKKVSLLKTPQDVLAIFRKPRYPLDEVDPTTRLVLALDGVQDPGNLGTIVRIADWFGIRQLVCSPDTADVFGPKAVQATMGALARVHVYYTRLPDFLGKYTDAPVYGAFLDGENLYDKKLSANGIIVMGNEGAGIRSETATFINERLYIPSYPSGHETSESLNVAVATGIVCAEFRRR